MPIPSREDWKFSAEFPEARLLRLEQIMVFESIVESMQRDGEVTCFAVRSGEAEETRGARRVEFRIELPPSLVDQFVNGRDGYRARFWQSPEIGDQANRLLIDAMKPRLLACVERHPSDDAPTRQEVCASLSGISAKVWIADEIALDLGGPREGKPDLIVEQWERRREGNGPWDEPRPYGYWAPLGTAVEIKGALLKSDGAEIVPARKQNRSQHIHCVGFT